MSPFSNVRMSPFAKSLGADFHGWGCIGDERFGARAFACDACVVERAGFAAGGGRAAGFERSAGEASFAQVARARRRWVGLAPARASSPRRRRRRSGLGSKSFCAINIQISGRRWRPRSLANARVSRFRARRCVAFRSTWVWRASAGAGPRAFNLRERRPRFGELIQIDGSPHDWFEGRGPRCTLIVFIDDATSRLTALRFAPAETTKAYLAALRDTFWPMAFRSLSTAIGTAFSGSTPRKPTAATAIRNSVAWRSGCASN